MSIRLKTRPTVTKRQFDTGDPAASTREEIQRIEQLKDHQVWYVNPMVTIASLAPDAAFFAEAQKWQGAFFRELRLRLGNGWRWQRQIDRKQTEQFFLSYDGVLMIEGELHYMNLPMAQSYFLETLVVFPVPQAYGVLGKADLSLVQALFQEQRQLFETNLSEFQEGAWFLIPSCTIIAMERSPRFEAECQRQWRLWNGKIRWLLKDQKITPEFADEVRKLSSLRTQHWNPSLPLLADDAFSSG